MSISDYIRKKNGGGNKKIPNNGMPDEATINKYSQMSENELMSELFNQGSVSKGQVSSEELDNFYSSASSFLTKEQREKMKYLIEQLKRS